jgi:sugar lactone lactonase YvrE
MIMRSIVLVAAAVLAVATDARAQIAVSANGHWSQGVAFAPDGRTILVGNMVEKDYWVFEWDGRTLRDTGQRVKVNGGPAGIRTADK